MLQIFHYLINNSEEKEKYELECHKDSFEFLPLSKDKTYMDISKDRPFYFLVIKITRNEKPESKENVLLNLEGGYMQIFSAIYSVFRDIPPIEAVSISYNKELNANMNHELIVHAAFMMENDNQLGETAFNDLTKLICNKLNIDCELPDPIYTEVQENKDKKITKSEETNKNQKDFNKTNKKESDEQKLKQINKIEISEKNIEDTNNSNKLNKKNESKNNLKNNTIPKHKYAPVNLDSMEAFNGLFPFTVSGTEDKIEDYFEKKSNNNQDNHIEESKNNDFNLIESENKNKKEPNNEEKSIEELAVKEKPIQRKKDLSRHTFEFRNIEGKKPTNPDDFGEDLPMLNAVDEYIPETNNENKELFVDIPDIFLSSKNLSISKEKFNNYFQKTLHYFTTTKHARFVSCQKPDALKNESKKAFLERQNKFMEDVDAYLDSAFPGQIPPQDKKIFLDRVRNALFSYYVLTALINHPDVTDIKVLSADKINVKIKGIHYTVRGVRFIDENDLFIFIQSLMIRNNVPSGSPFILFSDINFHPDYILRFNISIPALNTNGSFALHIRKVPKNKLLIPDLIEAGMMPEKVAAYLVDNIRKGKSMVFAGPNACGKTNILNAIVEEIPYTESILCVQESDEIFPLKHPIMMCQHILRDKFGRVIFGLDPIGQNGLVCDTGYFIIGEIKGSEARPFLRASNTGSTCLCTIHTPSAKETLPRFADYIKYGADYSMGEALRMLKDLNIIVYLENFKIQEISEIVGFDDDKQKIIYKTIYRRDLEK